MLISPSGVSNPAAEHYRRVSYDVYGPRMRLDLAISIFTRKMLKNEPTVFGDGEQTRDFTYIDDIVKANLDLLKTNVADGYAMNVGGGHRITVNDLIAHLRETTGSASEVVYSDKQKGDTEHTLADIQLASKRINYNPLTKIEDGLMKYAMWHKNLVGTAL